jgi:hypothetical protein
MLYQIPPGFSNIYYPRPIFYYPYPRPVIKPPLVKNQAEFSLFQYPDYFGFYENKNIIPVKINTENNENIPKQEVPKLIFTDLNIHSNDYIPGKEWSPSTSNTSSPRSNGSPRSTSSPSSPSRSSSIPSTPKSNGSPRSSSSNTSTPRNIGSPRSSSSSGISPRTIGLIRRINHNHGIIPRSMSNITIYKK